MVKNLLSTILFIFLFSFGFETQAQSFQGKDFWLGFMNNSTEGAAPDTVSLQVHIVSEINCQATISVPLRGYTITRNVLANTVLTVTIPRSVASNQGVLDGKRNTGVHVTTTEECVVYVGNYMPFSSDAATAVPTSSLGNLYHVIGYGVSGAGSLVSNVSEFIVVATENATSIQVAFASGSDSYAAGSTQNFTLNAGELMHFSSSGLIPIIPPGPAEADLAGTVVTSNKKVAVFSGNNCTYVGACPFCDHLFEQVRPLVTWSYEYFGAQTYKGPTRASVIGDILRVYSPQAGTTVTVNGIAYNLGANQFTDIELVGVGVAGVGSYYATSNNPVHISQYLKGSSCHVPPAEIDPLMMDILGSEQYASKYIFGTSSYTRYVEHYATVVVPTGKEGTLRLNGAPVTPINGWTPVLNNNAFSVGYLLLGVNRNYTILSNDNTGFGLYVYGYGVEEAYGYTAGGQLQDLCQVSAPSFNVCPGTNSVVAIATSPFLSNGAVIQWYTTPTGGTPVFTGTNYDLGTVTTTETYYVQVNNIGCNNKRTRIDIGTAPVPTSTYQIKDINGNVITEACEGQDVVFEYTGSLTGLSTHQFLWNFGPDFQASPITNSNRLDTVVRFTNASATPKSISLIASDNGCNSPTTTKNLLINRAATADFTVSKNAFCSGDTATVLYTGTGTGSGTYNWDFGTGNNIVANPDYKTYKIVWDSPGNKMINLAASDFGCGANNLNRPVVVNDIPNLDSTVTGTVACASSDGQAIVTVVNNNGNPYTINWVYPDGVTTSSNDTISNIPSGTYNVTVTDNIGCRSSRNVVVPAGNAPPATSSVVATKCTSSSDGSASIGLQNPNDPRKGPTLTYKVYNASGTLVFNQTTNQASQNVGGLAAGNYTYTIETNGCNIPGSFAIPTPTALIASAPTASKTVCSGAEAQFTINATGGSSPYAYSKDGISYSPASTQPGDIRFVPTKDTTMVIYVKDKNNCISTTNINVTVPIVSGTLASTPTVCVLEEGEFTLNGALPTDNIDWGDFGGAKNANPVTAGDLSKYKLSWVSSGLKTVTAQITRSGCKSSPISRIVQVSNPPEPDFRPTQNENKVCVGQQIDLIYDGVFSNGASLVWDFGTGATASGQPTIVDFGTKTPSTVQFPLTYSTAGQRTVKVTAFYSPVCTKDFTQVIDVIANPVAPNPTTVDLCKGQPDVLLRISDELFPIWYDSLQNQLPNAPIINASNVGTTRYFAQREFNGCRSTLSPVDVIVHEQDNAAFNYTDRNLCIGEPVSTITGSPTAGGVYTSTPSGLSLDPVTGQINPLTSTPRSSAYVVQYITTGVCADTASQQVRIFNNPNSFFFYEKGVYCQNDVDPQIQLGNTGTKGNLTSTPSGMSFNPDGSVNLMLSKPNTYDVMNVVSNTGCSDTSNFNVTIIEKPNVAFQTLDAICIGQDLNVTPLGLELPNTSYSWTFGTSANPSSASQFAPPTIVYDAVGSQNIVVFANNNGCTDTAQFRLIVKPLPRADIGANVELPAKLSTQSASQEIIFSAAPTAESFVWNFGDGSPLVTTRDANHTFNNIGEYTVILKASNAVGCDAYDTTLVRVVDEYYLNAPNAFSPNRDNTNDGFQPEPIGVNVKKFQIYDRWGQIVFENDNGAPWDGKHNGEDVPDGVYIYQVEGVSTGGVKVSKKGTVTLYR
jgi:gliding motility-associated-like protein